MTLHPYRHPEFSAHHSDAALILDMDALIPISLVLNRFVDHREFYAANEHLAVSIRVRFRVYPKRQHGLVVCVLCHNALLAAPSIWALCGRKNIIACVLKLNRTGSQIALTRLPKLSTTCRITQSSNPKRLTVFVVCENSVYRSTRCFVYQLAVSLRRFKHPRWLTVTMQPRPLHNNGIDRSR